jgi:hypothetical protein
MRIEHITTYVMCIEAIRKHAERQGRKCNPVEECYLMAYAVTHPDKVTICGDAQKDIYEIIYDDGKPVRETIKIRDEQHFSRFRNTQRQLRKIGKREFELPAGQDFAVAVTAAFFDDLIEATIEWAKQEGVPIAPSKARRILRQHWHANTNML